MGKKSRAIGFAVYLDELERLYGANDFDVDVLVCYGDNDIDEINLAVQSCREQGKSVIALKNVPQTLKFKEKIDLCKERK